MTEQPRMRCGNDPRARLTPGDQAVIDQFRKFLDARKELGLDVTDHLFQALQGTDLTTGQMSHLAVVLLPVVQAAAAAATRRALEPLAPMFEGLELLLATSSRDWQPYRVDAWLYAVLVGWDCEDAAHTASCVHGAMEETAALHGWDDATVAKARRYRAAVRAVQAATVAFPAREEQRCGGTVPHPAHTYMRMEVLSQCPGVEGAPDLAERDEKVGPVTESGRRYAEHLRSHPGKASADGHSGWDCAAGASLLVGADTPRPGMLGIHHGVIYACAAHQAMAVERVTAAGYEVAPRPAPPSHRRDPWPCGHVTAYDTAALTALTTVAAVEKDTRAPAGAPKGESTPLLGRGGEDL